MTLTELVLVMAVLLLLLGLAVPSLAGLTGSRQDVSATRVRGALIHAQQLAMSSDRHTWVAFDSARDLVSIYAEAPGKPGLADRLPVPDPLTRAPMVLSLGGKGTGIEALSPNLGGEVGFDPMGTPHDFKGFVLVLDGTISMTGGATIRVTRNTGLITLD